MVTRVPGMLASRALEPLPQGGRDSGDGQRVAHRGVGPRGGRLRQPGGATSRSRSQPSVSTLMLSIAMAFEFASRSGKA